jgi:hypothetical protein
MTDRPACEIEITPEMIEAGVYEARGHALGAPLAELVTMVFVTMIDASKRSPRLPR